jgi:hypothetical protein
MTELPRFDHLDDPTPPSPDAATLADVYARARQVDVVDLRPDVALPGDDITIVTTELAPEDAPVTGWRRRLASRRARAGLAAAAAIVLVLAAVAVIGAWGDGGTRVETAAGDDTADRGATTTGAASTPASEVTPTTAGGIVPVARDGSAPTAAPTAPATLDTSRALDRSRLQFTATPAQLFLAPGAAADVAWSVVNTGDWWVEIGGSICRSGIGSGLCTDFTAPPPGQLHDGLGPGATRHGSFRVEAPAGAAPGDYSVTVGPYGGTDVRVTVYDPNDISPLQWSWTPKPVTIATGATVQVTLRAHNPRPWPITYWRGGECAESRIEPAPGNPAALPPDEQVCTMEAISTVIAPGATVEIPASLTARRNGTPLPPGAYEWRRTGVTIPVTVTS